MVPRQLSAAYLESARARPLLLAGVVLPGGLGQDAPLGDEHHVLSAELLLQLPHQSAQYKWSETEVRTTRLAIQEKLAFTCFNHVGSSGQ